MEREDDFLRLVRRGSDYDELLRAGHVVCRVEHAEEWRQSMREQARGQDQSMDQRGIPNRSPGGLGRLPVAPWRLDREGVKAAWTGSSARTGGRTCHPPPKAA